MNRYINGPHHLFMKRFFQAFSYRVSRCHAQVRIDKNMKIEKHFASNRPRSQLVPLTNLLFG